MTKTPLNKRRGRPVGSKNKVAAKPKPFKRSVEQRVLHNIVDENLQLIELSKNLNKQLENLKHQIVGFRAVISYLENRLGMASSQ
jgi:hypothetical protein